ncbi:MAG: serine/threonine protein kinase [Myxococcales bacterium]|nr:serine/threonine protein kinase [Myxococcales bacterium]
MKKPIQFGKYWLLDRVNVGGMAEVWKAKAFGVEGFERLLAVKRILPNIAEDEEFITMFIDEAKIAVQLNHANIAQIFDLGKVDDSYFIALEFVHGKDLRGIYDRCKQKPVDGSPAMPIAQACFIMMKACEGLDYAHNKKDVNARELHLVHRDVSPQNILISYEGEVKLIDFGIAKAAGKASKTQQGILKGKFGYMSPEQVRGLPLDRRSDIFSLGICLYEMLTGERLFVGESDFSTLEKVRNVEILPPSTYNRRIGDELERICMKALAKDVDDRYQNAIDLHDDLQAFMYTAGEFYSRKDLAAWMKRVWAKEIEEESVKLELYRHMPVPPVAPMTQQPMPGVASSADAGRPRRNSGAIPVSPPPVPPRNSGQHQVVAPPVPGARPSGPLAIVPPPPGANGAHHAAPHEEGLGWDEEELATNIYSGPGEEDAAGDIVDDKPDLSKVSLNPNGAPVPHHSVATKLPTAPEPAGAWKGEASKSGADKRAANGTGRRNPFDYVLPEAASAADAATVAPATETPSLSARKRTRPMSLYVGAGVVGAAICVAAAAGVVYYNSRPGTLFIASEPATNVQILLDNKRQSVDGTPATLKLEPGSYVLTVQREGYVPWNEQVEIKPGDTTRRRISLEPLASGTGFTLVSDPAGAQALLDGRALEGVTPLKVQSVMPGKHKIEVKTASGAWSQDVSIEAGKMLDVRATIAPAVALAVPKSADRAARQPSPVAKAPPAAPVVQKSAEKTPDKSPPVAAAKVKEPEPPRDKPAPAAAKSPDKTAAEASKKKSSSPDVSMPDEDKPAPKKVASADKTAEPKAEKVTEKASAGGEGYLRLGSKPWTNIVVDGKETGLHTPQTHLKLASGSHRITLINPQFNIKETFSVDIKSGETETVIKDLRQQGASDD